MERKLSTILVADAVGSSKLMSVDEEGALRALSLSRDAIRGLVSEHHGRVFSGAGDSLLAEFGSAVEAVRCAVAIQERLGMIEMRPRLEFRIGLHLGDVVVDGGDLMGDGVNIAVRLEALAEPRGICASATVLDQVEGKLPVLFEPLGERMLKNLPRPIRVYRVVRGAERPAVTASDAGLPTIAVLPFANIGGTGGDDPFVDGIAEDVIANLARFRELQVIAWTSTRIYRGRTIGAEQIGRELGARYVVEGNVRRAGSKARIHARLTRIEDGTQVWAERYDRDVTDIFAVQDELANKIVASLVGKVAAVERTRMRQGGVYNLKAYGYFVSALEHAHQFTEGGNREARSLLMQALAIDPDFARAYAVLAMCQIHDWRFRWGDDPDAMIVAAETSARRAILLDETNAHGHLALGNAYLYGGQLELALDEYRRAIALNPHDPDVLVEYGSALTFSGRPEEGLTYLERAVGLNPICPDWYLWFLGDAYFCLGRYDDVLRVLRRMRDSTQGLRLLAAASALLGNLQEAKAYGQDVLRHQPNFTIAAWARGLPGSDSAVMARLQEGLRAADLPQ